MDQRKPVHSIVIDAGPLLRNDPSISTLLIKSERLYTAPSVVSEIKDVNARSRFETTIRPFITIRSPSLKSIKVVTDFARRTGDLPILSQPDLHILALAYELECELNSGDWRLRQVPGQKRLNGKAPVKGSRDKSPSGIGLAEIPADPAPEDGIVPLEGKAATVPVSFEIGQHGCDALAKIDMNGMEQLNVSDDPTLDQKDSPNLHDDRKADLEGSDSDGWITPSNLKKTQAKDQQGDTTAVSGDMLLRVATITTDFAMQNVLLQMNLNLLSPALHRVKNLKTFILRCHACFEKTKDMTKQFCPRCGKPTLNRVSCSTSSNGEFRLHLKKNMQWNTRGDRFSIPKPVHGTANGKTAMAKGGGRGGWGQELILAEDQKEYLQAMSGQKKKKERNLMDEDYLPNILTGDRGKVGGRPKIGAGRNVNSMKR
ncbi:Nin1 binding protein [Bachmanniomyces sp. S44760]|nr:Nin1 binding protein [Bachmanniomyces sp. S44760]